MRKHNVLIVFIAMIVCQNGLAQSDRIIDIKRFAPDIVNVQFAGNAGFLSGGAHWQFAKERIELGVSFGYIPASRSSKIFYASTFKAMYRPKWTLNYKQFSWEPFAVGPIVSRYQGLDLSRYSKNRYYPKNYYWWGIKNRVGLAISTDIKLRLNKGPFSGVSWYLETSTWDVYFYSVFTNGNFEDLGLKNLVVMGTGLKFFLKQ